MTVTKPTSTSRSSSDDSLVLVESGDAFSVSEMTPPEQVPSITSNFSYESFQEEGESSPILASNIRVVENISQPGSTETFEINDDNEDDINDEEDDVSRERKVGAGIAVGIMTAPFVGPVLAVVAGVAAAYGTSQKGVAGDACRAAGDIAIVAKEKAIEVDQKHDIVKKTKDGASKIIEKAKDMEEKHDILEKVKKVVICTLKNVADALQFAADKMKETRDNRRAAREAASFDANEELSSAFSCKQANAQEVQK